MAIHHIRENEISSPYLLITARSRLKRPHPHMWGRLEKNVAQLKIEFSPNLDGLVSVTE